MTLTEIIIGISIHLVLPLVGIYYFIRLTLKIRKEKIAHAPVIELFLICSTYGALLILILTSLFWEWSGMASIGVAFLIFVAPVLMGFISFRHRKTRAISIYHRLTHLAAILYFIIAPITFLLLYIAIEYMRINGI